MTINEKPYRQQLTVYLKKQELKTTGCINTMYAYSAILASLVNNAVSDKKNNQRKSSENMSINKQ